MQQNPLSPPHSTSPAVSANPHPHLSWNTLIKSHVAHHRSHDAILHFSKSLLHSPAPPDNSLIPCVLKACSKISAFEEGRQLHGLATKIGLPSDGYTHCSLISLYAKSGDINGAQKIFDSIHNECLIGSAGLAIFNSLLDGYAKCGELVLAQKLFDEMPERDSYSWTAMIDGYSRIGNVGEARRLFDQMLNKKIDQMSKTLISSVTWNAMINGYMKSGDCASAEELFGRMPERNKNIITWNSMIAGYDRNGRYMEALETFHKLLEKKHLSPNNSTLVCTLSAVSGLALLEKGRWIHSYIDRKGIKVDGVLGTSLIEMYSRCGSVESALSVFQGISKKKLAHWTGMIVGLAAHGMADRALELFGDMQRLGIKPHPITFIGILNACSHAGKIEEGFQYFELMKQEYRIEPTVEHYGCLVDLLCRAGHVKEAMCVVQKMPMKPNKVIWMSLLSGCRKHGNVDIAEYAAKRTIEQDPKAIGSYILLSNVYAAAGQWDRVSMVREAMKEKGVRKTPGCSFIEHNDILHRFVVADRSHPQTTEIYAKLNEMSVRLNSAGYVPDLTQVLLCIESEKKEAELANHSERLAIAFGLINVKPGMPVHIVKNLRVCNDCHNVTKLLSSIYGREIIVRDNSRFHHFRNGSCSCMDYW